MPTSDIRPGEKADVEPIRVVVVDDEAYVLRALQAYLSKSPRIQVLGAFASAADALPFLRGTHADVVLTDVAMPGLDGLELLSRLKQESPSTAVVVLTGLDDDTVMMDALGRHANGFLLKSAEPDDVVRAVFAAYDGGTPLSPDAASKLVAKHLRPVMPDRAPGITTAEQEVLTLLCDGMSNAEIADMLAVAESTVKRHVSSLMHKYGVNSRLRLVVAANKAGSLPS
ncbi:response regulator transcription factor [Actinomyces sp. Z5]|uniref:response regulator n=1 Tax=Actinomyces sp. Z5 TaxID=2250216 RepID=UPI00215C283D|nr:response regulator transcription factor [Actinomyces sp. Z5]